MNVPAAWDAWNNGAEATKQLDTQLAQMVADGNAAKAAQYIQALGISVDDVKSKLPEYSSAVSGAKPALEGLGGAASDAAGGVDELDKKNQAAFDSAKYLEQAAKDLKAALDELGGKAMDADTATSKLEAAYDSATAAAEKSEGATKNHGKALDLSTEAGRTAQSALQDIATSADNVATAYAASGRSSDEIAAKTKEARKQFVEAATKMGLTKKAAEDLATKYGLIPREVKTRAELNEAEAILAAAHVRDAIENIPRTVPIDIIVRGGRNFRVIAADGLATGGYVAGPGTATSDSIPAMLSNGEYVLRAGAVSRLGIGLLDDLNDNGQLDSHKFSTGGVIRARFGTGGQARAGLTRLRRDTAALNEAQSTLADMLKSARQTALGIAGSISSTGQIGAVVNFSQLHDARQQLQEARRSLNLANTPEERAAAQASINEAQGKLAAATPGGILSALKGKLAGIRSFYSDLKSLKKRGLPGHLLKQIVDAGPVDGQEMTKALLAATPQQLKDIISTDRAILDVSESVGTFTTSALIGEQRGVVNSAVTRARRDAVYVSSVKLQLDSREVAAALLAYKRAMGNRPLGIS
jgi:chromosome segregation ATPase